MREIKTNNKKNKYVSLDKVIGVIILWNLINLEYIQFCA